MKTVGILAVAMFVIAACRPSTIGMVRIRGGTFTTAGCSPDNPSCSGESPAQQFAVKSFWIDTTLVTQAQYQSVMGKNPSRFAGCANCPVEEVTWLEARRYCAKVGKRLPTENEWEYAARGGTTGVRYGDLDAIAWHRDNSGRKTHPVAQKRPNAYGLYDMLGNVWQWCEDMTYGRNVLPSLPPEAPNSGWYASLRGGCATSDPREVSVASGLLVTPDTRDLNCRDCMHNVLEWRPPSVSPSPVVYFGFRCARG